MDSRTPCLTRCATSPPCRCCRKSWKSRLTKTLRSSNRPPIRPDGWTRTRRSEGVPSAERPTGRTSRFASSGEESPSGTDGPDQTAWRRVPIPTFGGLAVFQTRTFFHLPRRRSSGYFSSDGDSMPSSPLSPRPPPTDSATQTPSPSGQVMLHALECLAHRFGARARQQPHGRTVYSCSRSPYLRTAGEMQDEAIGQELRRIGDDFNRLIVLRRMEGRLRRVVTQEPIMLLGVGILLLVIGRIIYLHLLWK